MTKKKKIGQVYEIEEYYRSVIYSWAEEELLMDVQTNTVSGLDFSVFPTSPEENYCGIVG